MKTIQIKLDYLNGPIWKDVYNTQTDTLSTGVSKVDEDIVLQVLNDKAEELYNSLYSFAVDGKSCVFNEEKYEERKPQLLSIINTIIYRLNEINDGSYIVEDYETPRLISTKVS